MMFTVAVTVQPPPNEYVITVVPGAIPVTAPAPPAPALTTAAAVLLLVHIPPPAVCPILWWPLPQTCSMPLITDGAKFTIMVVVAVQPAAVV